MTSIRFDMSNAGGIGIRDIKHDVCPVFLELVRGRAAYSSRAKVLVRWESC